MKRTGRMFIIIAAAAALVLTLTMTALAYSDEDYKYGIDGGYLYFDKGTNTVTYCDGNVAKVDIPSSIDSVPVKKIAENAFTRCSSLTEVSVPGSVETIGDYAFQNCSQLKKVTIAKGVSRIGAGAFMDCSSLTDINIPEGVEAIEASTFEECTKLESIVIPRSVTEIGDHAFMGCSGLRNVTLNEGLLRIELEAFHSCRSLTDIDIPSTVEMLDGRAFAFCNRLENITVGNGSSTYVSVDGMVYSSDMSSLVICPPGRTSAVITLGTKTIKGGAFDSCNKLTEINIPDSVEKIEYSALGGDSLEMITVSEGNLHYKSVDGMLYSKDGTRFIRCPNKKSGNITVANGVTEIAEWAFGDCNDISGIKLPNSLTSIKQYAFWFCSKIEELNIPKNVSNIDDEAIVGGDALKSINVAAGNRWYRSIDGVLYNYDLTKLILCPAAKTSLTIPDTVTEIGRAFTLSRIENLVIPDSVKILNNSAFEVSELKTIVLSKNLTEIASHTFNNCSNLSLVKLQQGMKRISWYAFRECGNLENITIPGSVTDIEEGAFRGCDKLMIYGITGSVAYNYAKMHRIPFVSVNSYIDTIQKGKYDVVVVDEKNQPIEGAEVICGNSRKITDSQGAAEFDMTSGSADITVSCDGYTSCSFKKSRDKFNIVVLYHTEKSALKLKNVMVDNRTDVITGIARVAAGETFSVKCTPVDAASVTGYEIWQNGKKKASSKNGSFTDLDASAFSFGAGIEIKTVDSTGRYIVTHVNLEIIKKESLGDNALEIGSVVKVSIDEDFPVIAGRQMQIDTLRNLSLEMKSEGANFYIGINIDGFDKMSSDEIKKCIELLKKINSEEKTEDAEKQLQEIVEKYASKPEESEFNLSMIGFGEGTFDKNGFASQEIPVYLGVYATVERHSEWSDTIEEVPVIIKADTSMATANVIAGSFNLRNAEFSDRITFKFNPKTQIYIKPASDSQAEGGGYGSIDYNADVSITGYNRGINSITAEAEGWFTSYINSKKYEKLWPKAEYEINNIRTVYDDEYEEDEYALFANRSVQTGTIKSVSDLIHPSVVSNGETMVMAYLDADTSRGVNNAAVVKYSIYDESTGTWGEPVKMDSNGTADYQPQLYLLGQDIYLTYRDGSAVCGDEDDTSAGELVKQQNICAAKFNSRTRAFETISTVAEADDKYRSCQTAGIMNENAVTAWVENSGDDIFNRNNTNEIWYSTYDGTSWSAPEKEITGARGVTALAVTDSGIAYVSDMNKELRIGQTVLDSGNISGLKACDGTLMWTNDGILKKYDRQTVLTVFDDIRVSSEFVSACNTLYYTVAGEGCSNIYGRKYDAASGSWSEAVRITSGDRYIDYLSAAELNGILYAAFTDTKVSTGNNLTRECNLSWCRLEEVTDLTVEDAEYDSAAVVPGGQVTVSVTVRNSGSSAIDTAGVAVTDESGNTVYASAVNMELAAGASKQIEVPVEMGDTISEHTYSISVNVNGDRNTDDNSIETVIGYTDFELECEQVQVGDVISFYMTVTNRSHAASSGRVEITCGDKCTYTADVPVLEYGESCTSVANLSEIALSDGTSGQIRVEAVADAAEDEKYNNYELVYLNLDYDITYYAQAGDESAFTVESKTYDEYAEITEKRPVRDGYRFLGWSTDSEAKAAEYTAGNGISTNRNLTLYGVWKQSREYTVSGNIISYSDEKAVIKVYPKGAEKKDIICVNKYGIVSLNSEIALPYETASKTPVAEGDTYTGEYSAVLEAGEYVLAVYVPEHGLHIENIEVTDSAFTRDINLYLLGDANGDGKVRIGDKAVLARYIAEWKGYDKLLNEEAADINGDGIINAADRMLLERHLAGWGGYEVLEYGMNTGEY